MSYSDVEHCASMISGCESLRVGNVKDPNAVYAFTVLKLHAGDAGFIAGQEGFLDSIKKGAGKFLEWVKKLIRAIKDYLKGITKDDRARITELEKIIKETKFENADLKVTPSLFTGDLSRLKDKLQGLETVDGLPSVEDLEEETEKFADTLDKSDYSALLTKAFALRDKFVIAIEKYNKFVESETSKLKEEDQVTAEVKAATKTLHGLAFSLQIINHIPEIVQRRVNTIFKNWDYQHKLKKDKLENAEFEKAKLEKGKDK